ncbi:hypothetical protein BaRGS_00001398 [Batillaria attramentaria]|uniref:Uncharacterized protein n=1 Tax=Batillaria attramentaria TaxID=370345 RepID=A0ABD0M7J4_9CAEN
MDLSGCCKTIILKADKRRHPTGSFPENWRRITQITGRRFRVVQRVHCFYASTPPPRPAQALAGYRITNLDGELRSNYSGHHGDGECASKPAPASRQTSLLLRSSITL